MPRQLIHGSVPPYIHSTYVLPYTVYTTLAYILRTYLSKYLVTTCAALRCAAGKRSGQGGYVIYRHTQVALELSSNERTVLARNPEYTTYLLPTHTTIPVRNKE